MAFSSLVFLFLFFPVAALVHFFSPKAWKNGIVLAASVAFYAWSGLDFLLLIFAASFAAWLLALLIEKAGSAAVKTLLLSAGVLLFVGSLFYYKYLPSIGGPLFGMEFSRMALPLGISFYVFSLLSYLFDVYWEKCGAQKNFGKVLSYVLFFPKVVQGPIMRWDSFSEQLENRSVSSALVAEGLRRFVIGLFKKLVIADQLTSLVSYSFNNPSATGTVPAWFCLLAQLLQLYYDFSGYSDMAIGAGALFGFALPENFDHPYLSLSVAEYWRRWHVSLGIWFRDYVYMPFYRLFSKSSVLRKATGGLWIDLSALLITWILTGVWHGSGKKFFYYGLWWFVFIALERVVEYAQKKWRKARGLKKAQMGIAEKCVRRVETLFAILIGQVIFRAADLPAVFAYVKNLFVWSAVDDVLVAAELGNEVIAAFVIGVVFCFPVHKILRERVFEKSKAGKALYAALLVLMFLLSFLYSLSNGYSPFLYQVF